MNEKKRLQNPKRHIVCAQIDHFRFKGESNDTNCSEWRQPNTSYINVLRPIKICSAISVLVPRRRTMKLRSSNPILILNVMTWCTMMKSSMMPPQIRNYWHRLSVWLFHMIPVSARHTPTHAHTVARFSSVIKREDTPLPLPATATREQ